MNTMGLDYEWYVIDPKVKGREGVLVVPIAENDYLRIPSSCTGWLA